MAWYREFAYLLGGVAREGKAGIPGDIIAKVVSYHGKPGLGDCFRFRVRNISEGLAIGSYRFITEFQKQCQRKFNGIVFSPEKACANVLSLLIKRL